ncbi:hypothetical protein Tco_1353532 [Tanacetum coccineum]
MCSMKFGMNYDNTNDDPHTNGYEVEVQRTIYIPDLDFFMPGGYLKGDRTKHILPKFLVAHDLQKSDDIIVHKICSSENLADLSTKALPTTTFKKLVH